MINAKVKLLFETLLTSEDRSVQGDLNLKITEDRNLLMNLIPDFVTTLHQFCWK